MVRNYLRKKSKNYSDDDIAQAINTLKDSFKPCISRVASQFKIPRKTLSDHWKAIKQGTLRHCRSGHPTTLNTGEEENILIAMKNASQYGWVVNRQDIRLAVSSYCHEQNMETCFRNKKPGFDWMQNFYRRWNEHVNPIFSHNIELISNNDSNRKIKFLTNYKDILKELNLHDSPDRMFTLNEITIKCDSSKKNFSCCANDGKIIDNKFSALICCNAQGNYVNPFIVYRNDHKFKKESTKFHEISCVPTKCGWMEDNSFSSWLGSTFLDFLRIENIELPVVVLLDSFNMNISFTKVHLAKSLGIHLVSYPFKSESFQPLQMFLKWMFSNIWNVKHEMHSNIVAIDDFVQIFQQLFTEINYSNKSVDEFFSAIGLHPIDEKKFSEFFKKF